MHETKTSTRDFIWPPASGGRSSSASGAIAESRGEGHRGESEPSGQPSTWRDAMLEIERTWLGLERAPLVDLIRESGWRADSAATYCARCGVTAGGEETLDPFDSSPAEAGCRHCRGRASAWDRLIRLGEYDGFLREAVLETKFRRARGVGRALGVELGGALRRAIERSPTRFSEVALVPAPTSFWRRFQRGIDHSRVIATGVSDASGFPIRGWLARSHREAQSTLSEAKRAKNIAGAMRLSWSGRRAATAPPRPGLIVVIDDVTTTGATLREACRVLRRGLGPGIELWCLVVGVTA